ncbi:MAG TPA: hypothetical protein VIM84_00035 [Gemmatimonadales bacterium]
MKRSRTSADPTSAATISALRLIKGAEERSRAASRRALRRKVEEASIRPAPGTSDLLGRSMSAGIAAGVDGAGRLRAAETYDLVGMAPVHLVGHRGFAKFARPRGRKDGNR